MKKIYFASLVVALAIFGAYFFPRPIKPVLSVGAVGDTNSTSAIAECQLDISTTTPTYINGSSCLTNTGSADRIVTSVDIFTKNLTSATMTGATGAGLASWTWTMSTSSGVYVPSSTNYLLNAASVATSSEYNFTSSTTPLLIGKNTPSLVWAAGSNLNILTNGTSTSVTSSVVVHYLIGQ